MIGGQGFNCIETRSETSPINISTKDQKPVFGSLATSELLNAGECGKISEMMAGSS